MGTILDSLTVTDLAVLKALTVDGAPVYGGAAEAAFAKPVVPDSEATNVRQLVADHNALLAALRTAGVLAEEVEQ